MKTLYILHNKLITHQLLHHLMNQLNMDCYLWLNDKYWKFWSLCKDNNYITQKRKKTYLNLNLNLMLGLAQKYKIFDIPNNDLFPSCMLTQIQHLSYIVVRNIVCIHKI